MLHEGPEIHYAELIVQGDLYAFDISLSKQLLLVLEYKSKKVLVDGGIGRKVELQLRIYEDGKDVKDASYLVSKVVDEIRFRGEFTKQLVRHVHSFLAHSRVD